MEPTQQDAFLALALLAIGLIVYFIPFWVALFRSHRNTGGIFVLNFFLGWTLVGWVGALIWACWNDKPGFAVTYQPPAPAAEWSNRLITASTDRRGSWQ